MLFARLAEYHSDRHRSELPEHSEGSNAALLPESSWLRQFRGQSLEDFVKDRLSTAGKRLLRTPSFTHSLVIVTTIT